MNKTGIKIIDNARAEVTALRDDLASFEALATETRAHANEVQAAAKKGDTDLQYLATARSAAEAADTLLKQHREQITAAEAELAKAENEVRAEARLALLRSIAKQLRIAHEGFGALLVNLIETTSEQLDDLERARGTWDALRTEWRDAATEILGADFHTKGSREQLELLKSLQVDYEAVMVTPPGRGVEVTKLDREAQYAFGESYRDLLARRVDGPGYDPITGQVLAMRVLNAVKQVAADAIAAQGLLPVVRTESA